MRASRGMGAIAESKMPKAKTITRKDDPNKVSVYKRGGKVNAAGKQFVAQPKRIAKKTASFR
jgi:hypothetical protein